MAIDRTKIAVLVGPFVPDGDTVVLEVLDVGVAGYEPKEFVDDGFEVNLFGGQKRETFGMKVLPSSASTVRIRLTSLIILQPCSVLARPSARPSSGRSRSGSRKPVTEPYTLRSPSLPK